MVTVDDDLSLSDAIQATEHLTLRELASHVHVGPLPSGVITPLMLPLKELLASIPLLTFFLLCIS